MEQAGPTTDHDVIRRWAAVNGAIPVEIGTILHDGEPIQIGFVLTKGRKPEPEFKPISWEGFFALFDLMHLSFVHKDNSYELLQTGAPVPIGYAVPQN